MSEEFQNDLVMRYCSRLNEDDPDTVVREAILDPQLFVFAELFDHERIAQVSQTWRDLLNIMAFGEVCDLPPNCENEISEKMKILTISSYIRECGWIDLRFDDMQIRLGIPVGSDVELVRVILAMNRARLASLRIDEQARTVDVVDMFVGRDLHPSLVQGMLDDIRKVQNRATYMIEHTDNILKSAGVMDLEALLRHVPLPPTPERESKRGRISASD